MITHEILLVEPESLFREVLAQAINSREEFQVIGEVGSHDEALEQALKHYPSLIVTEVFIDGLSGIELVRKLRKEGCRSKVVVLSSKGPPELVKDTVLAGAHGYVLKSSAFEVLMTALNRALLGQTFIESSITQKNGLPDYRTTSDGSNPIDILTPREKEIFCLLVTGIRNIDIAERLYISPRTVETHRARIARKLGVRTNAELVHCAIAHGYAQDKLI